MTRVQRTRTVNKVYRVLFDDIRTFPSWTILPGQIPLGSNIYSVLRYLHLVPVRQRIVFKHAMLVYKCLRDLTAFVFE